MGNVDNITIEIAKQIKVQVLKGAYDVQYNEVDLHNTVVDPDEIHVDDATVTPHRSLHAIANAS